ncbi:cytochrome P450 CYP72A219-like [Nicotiana tabacum]|uniref:Cytochrome P450 CYP72A219-like n=1 Tax=Nicotiana tabacum TaxID=4097 RepID=A0AC58S531_TOBAC
MVSKWEKIVSEKGSYELDLWPNLETLTSDALSRAAFGSNYEEVMKPFPLPGASYLPTKSNRRVKEIAREVRSSLEGIISQRLKAIEAKEAGNHDDLLGSITRIQFKGN